MFSLPFSKYFGKILSNLSLSMSVPSYYVLQLTTSALKKLRFLMYKILLIFLDIS